VRENIDAVRQLVSLLDQPEPHVEIEARIVIATRNFSRDLGVQLSALVLSNGRAAAFGTAPAASLKTLPVCCWRRGEAEYHWIQTRWSSGRYRLEPNNSLVSSIPNTVMV
jgi:hypothetical protein